MAAATKKNGQILSQSLASEVILDEKSANYNWRTGTFQLSGNGIEKKKRVKIGSDHGAVIAVVVDWANSGSRKQTRCIDTFSNERAD